MKLATLLVALAIAGTGSAFAASDTATGSTAPVARHGHKSLTSKAKTSKSRHHATHHASAAGSHKKGATQHMGASGQHMNSASTPQTDLQSRERQSRIDEAYSKWHSGRS